MHSFINSREGTVTVSTSVAESGNRFTAAKLAIMSHREFVEIYAKQSYDLCSANDTILVLKPRSSEQRTSLSSKQGDVVNFTNLEEHLVSFQITAQGLRCFDNHKV